MLRRGRIAFTQVHLSACPRAGQNSFLVCEERARGHRGVVGLVTFPPSRPSVVDFTYPRARAPRFRLSSLLSPDTKYFIDIFSNVPFVRLDTLE